MVCIYRSEVKDILLSKQRKKEFKFKDQSLLLKFQLGL